MKLFQLSQVNQLKAKIQLREIDAEAKVEIGVIEEVEVEANEESEVEVEKEVQTEITEKAKVEVEVEVDTRAEVGVLRKS